MAADQNIDIVVRLVDQFSAKMNTVQTRLETAVKGATSLGVAFTAAGAAITASMVFAVRNSSNLDESINAVGVTFGEATEKLLRYGETADQIGMSQRTFNEAITPIGALLQNVGISASEAADASILLAERAADVSSVFNKDLSVSLAAIGSGLRGETEPLKQFAVNLNETEVKAYALREGLIKNGQTMDEHTKIVARMGSFFEQTAKNADDFKNTSDGLANATRIASARFENMTALLVTALVPILEKLLSKVIPVIEWLQEWIKVHQKLTGVIVVSVAAFGALLLVLGPILLTVGQLPGAIAGVTLAVRVMGIAIKAALGPIGWIILALGLLVSAAVFLSKKYPEAWNKIVDATQSAVQFIVDVLINGLIGGFNLLMRALGKTDSQIQKVTVSLGFMKTGQYGPSIEELGTASSGFNNQLDLMEQLSVGAGSGISSLGSGAEKSSKTISEAMEEIGDAAEKMSKELQSSVNDSIRNIEDLQSKMEDLIIGKIEDTNDKRAELAQAYVDQEKEAADLRQEILDESDDKERMKLKERLKVLEEDLAANKTVELAFSKEVTKIREDAQKTSLQLAKDKFQESIFMIEQEFTKKFLAIQAELSAEMDKAEQLLKIKDDASKIAQEILLNEEKNTVESVNRQIETFNRLAQAVQNAKQGIKTGGVSLGATLTAQEKLRELGSSPSVNITINNPQVFSDQDIVDKIGDPILRVLKQHAAL